MIEEYIEEAKSFKTFNLADKAERNPSLWVDKMNDNSIEIHGCDLNNNIFIDEINGLVKDINNCTITFNTERCTVHGKYKNILYAIINI